MFASVYVCVCEDLYNLAQSLAEAVFGTKMFVIVFRKLTGAGGAGIFAPGTGGGFGVGSVRRKDERLPGRRDLRLGGGVGFCRQTKT